MNGLMERVKILITDYESSKKRGIYSFLSCA